MVLSCSFDIHPEKENLKPKIFVNGLINLVIKKKYIILFLFEYFICRYILNDQMIQDPMRNDRKDLNLLEHYNTTQFIHHCRNDYSQKDLKKEWLYSMSFVAGTTDSGLTSSKMFASWCYIHLKQHNFRFQLERRCLQRQFY